MPITKPKKIEKIDDDRFMNMGRSLEGKAFEGWIITGFLIVFGKLNRVIERLNEPKGK